MDKNHNTDKTRHLIKELLAEHIGVDANDIDEEDSFYEDLHMGPADLTDFIQTLSQSGIDIESIDLTKLESLGDLLESISETNKPDIK